MNTPQLPAYLVNNRTPRLAERATEGMGSPLPPHISIASNRFTLVDAAGQEKPIETLHLDVCVADRSDVMCKLYYGKDYEPGSTDPPLCFSANGIAPSREATQPQSATCQECKWNVRGSAVSKLTGAAIKACRDEVWLAVIVPSHDMIFQFRITPGSFKNWKNYAEKFKNQPFDITDVVTRLQFEQNANGVITFMPVNYIDEPTAVMRLKAVQTKSTDIFVGRNDQPIAALPAPAHVPAAAPPPNPAPPAAFGATPTPAFGQPAAQEPPRQRRQRKVAEPAAPGNGAPAAPAAAPAAPFRPTEAPFGIQQNAPAPPQNIADEMSNFFKQ